MSRRAARWLASTILAVTLAIIISLVVRSSFALDEGFFFLAPMLAFAVVGAVVAVRRPEHPIGWLYSAIGLTVGFAGLLSSSEGANLHAIPTLYLALDTLAALCWYVSQGLALTFALLLFPTGRLPSPRWRPVAWLGVLGIVLIGIGDQLKITQLGDMTILSAAGLHVVDEAVATAVLLGGSLVWATAVLASAASLVVRFRRARGQERQQLKWFAAAGALVAGMAVLVFASEALPIFLWLPVEPLLNALWPLAIAAMPVAAGIAILRYRLYDIDLIIRRTAVYAAVTATLVSVYLVAVVLFQGAFRSITGQESDLATVTATLLVAAAFHPVRRRIQAFIDRRFHRRAYDASATLAAYVAVLRDEVDFSRLNAELLWVVQETLQPAHASLWLCTTTDSSIGLGQ